jgi:IS30 family transposase
VPFRFSREHQRVFWDQVRSGSSVEVAALSAGVSTSVGVRWFRGAGGIAPPPPAPRSGRHLSPLERETIYLGLVLGSSYAEIARSIGRATSTVTRELDAHRLNPNRERAVALGRRRGARGRVPTQVNYSPSVAQQRFEQRLRRDQAQPTKLAANERLRGEVAARLGLQHSPEQISRRLREDFPDDAEMWVSHETIYKSLYVQGRGELRRELTRCLRTGRALRRPHRRLDRRQHRLPDKVSISERPPEVADRIVPGHWEGDLITGTENKSAIGTLVERTTRFTILLHLPADHGAVAVRDAMIAAMRQLPALLRKSLTWDQGIEMSLHTDIAAALELDVYFCDPASPWQRGTNENTNGLLRQYFPKGTDLSGYHPDYLAFVAAQLNDRPRKTLGWKTPAEAFATLLTHPPVANAS